MGLEIIKCYQTLNRCYIRKRSAAHIGILVHSTGAVNTSLKRYVDYPARLGKNLYGNHWNRAEAGTMMHALIGRDKDGTVIVANTLPYAYACWGCAKGANGSYNYDPVAHIQFEICQSSNTDADYYWQAMGVAAEYCAWLCQQFRFTADDICSHKEAARRGYANNHGDPESWMIHFGDDMTKFRERVATLLAGGTISTQVPKGDTNMETIRKGSSGAGVTALQQALNKLGDTLTVDGAFGAMTDASLRKYQAAHGLEADGVCGPITWESVNAAVAALSNGSDAETGIEDAGAADMTTYTLKTASLDAATATQLLAEYAKASAVLTIPGLDAATATQLLDTYPNSTAVANS